MVEVLKTHINECAKECCVLMTDVEKEQFFKYQEERIESGVAYHAKYTSIRAYYKGKKKGEIKEVWNIDGAKFTMLWNLLQPYAYQSSINSHGFDSYIIQEDMSEMKLWLFKILRFFGPTPTGITLSAYFPLLVNNYFTNSYNKNRRTVSSKQDLAKFEIRKLFKKYRKEGRSVEDSLTVISNDFGMHIDDTRDIVENIFETEYKTQYLYDEISSAEDDEAYVMNKIPQYDYNIFFTVDFPSDLREASELLMGGMKLKEVAARVGISPVELKTRYEDCIEKSINE